MSPEARPGREDREPREPWRSFLLDLGSRLSGPLDLHCIGGFAVTQMYGISRATADIDVLPALPGHQLAELRTLAGEGTELHRRHGIYIEPVTVVTYPVEYHTRLERLWPGFAPEVLRLWVLEPHDLALTKLERNQDVDRQDVQELAARGLLDRETLQRRYIVEFRPYITIKPDRADLTLELWLEMLRPEN